MNQNTTKIHIIGSSAIALGARRISLNGGVDLHAKPAELFADIMDCFQRISTRTAFFKIGGGVFNIPTVLADPHFPCRAMYRDSACEINFVRGGLSDSGEAPRCGRIASRLRGYRPEGGSRSRADAGFACGSPVAWCGAHGVEHLLGSAGNPRPVGTPARRATASRNPASGSCPKSVPGGGMFEHPRQSRKRVSAIPSITETISSRLTSAPHW